MFISGIQFTQLNLGEVKTVCVQPYQKGLDCWKRVFATPDCPTQNAASLKDRIKFAVLGTLLWIPLINIVVHIALRYLNGLPEEVKRLNKVPKIVIYSEDEKNAHAESAVSKLIEYFQSIDDVDNDAETPPIFNQQIHNLRQLGYDWKTLTLMARKIADKIFDSKGDILSKQKKAYIYYRLQVEQSLMALTESLQRREYASFAKWSTLEVPGDGNCFLWSCVLSLSILEDEDPLERFNRLKRFNSRHPDYHELNRMQENLREALVKGFAESLSKENVAGDIFKRNFCFYFLSTPALREKITLSEDEEEIIFATGQPSEEMVQIFINGLMENGTWNGEFEAEIVAQQLRRPIVILNEDKNLRTIAGGQFLDSNDPIIVQHSGDHYSALFYAP